MDHLNIFIIIILACAVFNYIIAVRRRNKEKITESMLCSDAVCSLCMIGVCLTWDGKSAAHLLFAFILVLETMSQRKMLEA